MIVIGNLLVICASLLLLVLFKRTRSYISLNGALLLALFFFLVIVKLGFLSDYRTLGFRTDNISDTLIPAFIFSLLSATVLFSMRLKRKKFKVFSWILSLSTLYLAFGLAQQVFFQGVFTSSLESVLKDKTLVVIFSGVFFSAFHAGWTLRGVSFGIFALLGGVVFSILYLSSPNLYVLGFAHAVLASLYYFLVYEGNTLHKRLPTKS